MNKFQKLIIWLSYNTGRNTDLKNNSKQLADEFKEATAGDNEKCNCNNKAYVVNSFWKNWHCTYCLKPKASKFQIPSKL